MLTMPRKRPANVRGIAPIPPPKPRRGRPPMEPRTTLARWIRDRGITVVEFAAQLAAAAPSVGLPVSAAPQTKALLDSVNALHWPHPVTMFLVRHATGGDVDLEHWIRDLRHLWPARQSRLVA